MTTKEVEAISKRKDEHINICLEKDIEYKTHTNGFQDIKLHRKNLVDIKTKEIDLQTRIFGKKLDFPIIISGMTGGSQQGRYYNRKIAKVCQEFNIGMGVGSQRIAIEDSRYVDTFVIRDIAPDIPLIANLGLPQFNKGYGIEEADKSVKMIEADALAIHINPLQEFVQPEGDKGEFSLQPLKEVISRSEYPILLKGIGNGFSKGDLKDLVKLRPYAIDVAGAGGTNWTRIECLRENQKESFSEEFIEQGITTTQTLVDAKKISTGTDVKLIASGGIRTGTDAVKALIIGADYVGFALPVLRAVAKGGTTELQEYLGSFITEMRATMAILGSENLKKLKKSFIKK